MASLDSVLSIDWIYSEGFELKVPNMVPEAILNCSVMLESASESDRTMGDCNSPFLHD